VLWCDLCKDLCWHSLAAPLLRALLIASIYRGATSLPYVQHAGLLCMCRTLACCVCARSCAGTTRLHLCYVPYVLPLYTEVPRHCLYVQHAGLPCMCCTLACGLCAMRCAGTTWMHLANFGLQPSYMHRRDVHMLWLYLCKDLPCVCALIDWPAAIEHAGVTCTYFGFTCARTCRVCALMDWPAAIVHAQA